MGKDGKEIVTIYTENVFMTRVCEEGQGSKGYSIIPKGWVEIYLPAKEEVSELIFVDSHHKESNQRLSLKGLLEKRKYSKGTID